MNLLFKNLLNECIRRWINDGYFGGKLNYDIWVKGQAKDTTKLNKCFM